MSRAVPLTRITSRNPTLNAGNEEGLHQTRLRRPPSCWDEGIAFRILKPLYRGTLLASYCVIVHATGVPENVA